MYKCFLIKLLTYLPFPSMEPTQKSLHSFEFQAFLPIKNQQILPFSTVSTVSDSASPVLAVAILSVMGTAFLLLGYYIFITKCFSNWQQFSFFRRFSSLHTSPQQHEDPFIPLSPTTMWNRGLDESMIRQIPAFKYGERLSGIYGCVVCLSEFRENEMLRVLPKCSHTFHLDCIDTWLQSNSNCPLCRTSISGITKAPIDQIVAPSSSPQNSQLLSNSTNIGSDDDFVVIELGRSEDVVVLFPTGQQQGDASSSPKKTENKVEKPKTRKCHHVSIMGDEGIDVRGKDEQLTFTQPIRRSFSMDSAADQQLYLTVQMIIHQGRQINESSSSSGGGAESDGRNQRSFFPFRSGRGCKNAVLPLESDM